MDSTLFTEISRVGAAASDVGILDWLRSLKLAQAGAALPISLRLTVIMLVLAIMLRLGFMEPRT